MDIHKITEYAKTLDRKSDEFLEIQDKIIESLNAEHIFLFAKKVKGSDTYKLGKAIIQTKNYQYMCSFAMHVDTPCFDEIKKALFEMPKQAYNTDWYLVLANYMQSMAERDIFEDEKF